MENKDVRILIVDDEASTADSLKLNLAEEGYTVDTAGTGGRAIELFDQGGHHLAICDLQLPDMDGLDVMRHMKDARPTTEVIVVTAHGSTTKAVEATKAGAFDFVDKPFNFEELELRVQNALKHRELIAENANLRRQLSTRSEYFNIIGAAKPMQTIYETIESVAKSDANVLIVGESGTGKELIANAIHYNSLRSKKPFIKVNCAALPKELIESELFGHTKGAFTGAVAAKKGLFEVADGGSIFLDEITTIPPETQARLLRVIQEREFTPLGDTQPRRVDVRIIAATNSDLQRAVKQGDFREDLFYRLNVINIHLPPLRERRSDILLLAQHFIRKYNAENGRKLAEQLSPEVLRLLEAYPWPGNVRELESTIERAVIVARGDEVTLECLREEILHPQASTDGGADSADVAASLDIARGISFYDEVSRFEVELIRRALELTGGHQSKAAKLLGMNNTTLNSKIKVYNIKP